MINEVGMLPLTAAVPPDVRWRLLPHRERATLTLWGYAPDMGIAQKSKKSLAGRSETFRTSERQSRRDMWLTVHVAKET
jgi:hypothetical protein